jgi:hypothetical protein
MKCPNCSLNTLAEFPAEVMIHCVGSENIKFSGCFDIPETFSVLGVRLDSVCNSAS